MNETKKLYYSFRSNEVNYLKLKGFKVVEKQFNGGQCRFYFEDTPELRECRKAWREDNDYRKITSTFYETKQEIWDMRNEAEQAAKEYLQLWAEYKTAGDGNG